jgi:hypothetical protein
MPNIAAITRPHHLTPDDLLTLARHEPIEL